jgi:hypothetical protein
MMMNMITAKHYSTPGALMATDNLLLLLPLLLQLITNIIVRI